MRSFARWAALSAAYCAGLAAPQFGRAQDAPLPSHIVTLAVDSGSVENSGPDPAVVFATTTQVPEAIWLRLSFDDVQLAGQAAAGTASYLRLTAAVDGFTQCLGARDLRLWQNSSAYFNGDAVLIELIAYPGTGPNHMAMSSVLAGERGYAAARSICGPSDDRVLSNDPRVGRLQPGGCTAFLIDDCTHCFYGATSCLSTNAVVEFNVPLSNPDGSVNHPPPEDQYTIDWNSVQASSSAEPGSNWAYFGCNPNTNTGLTPYEAQGAYFAVAPPPPAAGNNVRVTGYGTVTAPVPLAWNLAQKTEVGPLVNVADSLLQYTVDTTGGNTGAPVIWEETGQAVGIHVAGGCTPTGGANNGTGVNQPDLLLARQNPLGVCTCVTGLMVFPLDGFEVSGPFGGPFVPASCTYLLLNIGTVALDYEVTWTSPWLTLAGATGSLAGGEFATVTAVLNAAAAELPVGLYTDTLNFVNLTAHQGDTSRPATLHVGSPQPVYSWNLDTNPAWNVTGGQWAFGHPTGGGGAAHGLPDPNHGATGANVYGVNLNGDYATTPGGPYYLQLGPLDLSMAVADVSLRFQRWLNTDCQPYAVAAIEVSSDGGNWLPVWNNGTTELVADSWHEQRYDLSAVAAGQPTFYVRWGYRIAAGAWPYSGWNLDDVEIWAVVRDLSVLGDLNCDGIVNFDDLSPFVLALVSRAGYEQQYPNCLWLNGDCNRDGTVNFDDINPFVGLLSE